MATVGGTAKPVGADVQPQAPTSNLQAFNPATRRTPGVPDTVGPLRPGIAGSPGRRGRIAVRQPGSRDPVPLAGAPPGGPLVAARVGGAARPQLPN